MVSDTDRPALFDYWRLLSYINCPDCGAGWEKPLVQCNGGIFPGLYPDDDAAEEAKFSRAYCPHCGVLMPTPNELVKMGKARVSPVWKQPFIGSEDGIREFLAQSKGCETRLWEYLTSHSILILKIKSKVDDTTAFVVCSGMRTVQLPNIFWKSEFQLHLQNGLNRWLLVDDRSSATIGCANIGIFHKLSSFW